MSNEQTVFMNFVGVQVRENRVDVWFWGFGPQEALYLAQKWAGEQGLGTLPLDLHELESGPHGIPPIAAEATRVWAVPYSPRKRNQSYVVVTGSAVYDPTRAGDVDVWFWGIKLQQARYLAQKWANEQGLGTLPLDLHELESDLYGIPSIGPEDTDMVVLHGTAPCRTICSNVSAWLRRAARFGAALPMPGNEEFGSVHPGPVSLLHIDDDGADTRTHYHGSGIPAIRRALTKFRAAGSGKLSHWFNLWGAKDKLPNHPYWKGVAWLCDHATEADISHLAEYMKTGCGAGGGSHARYVFWDESRCGWVSHHDPKLFVRVGAEGELIW
jgi:hypothetical protein